MTSSLCHHHILSSHPTSMKFTSIASCLSHIHSHSNVTHLDLSNLHNATPQCIESLASTLSSTANNITSLNLRFSNISDADVLHLCQILSPASKCALSSLNLRANRITHVGLTSLCDALATNSTLRHLDLQGNRFDDESVRALSRALLQNRNLESLNLEDTRISFLGIRHLSEALDRETCSLRDLNIAGNSVGTFITQFVGRALIYNTSLEKLNLSVMGMGDEAIPWLTEALRYNTTLRELNLYGNEISMRGAMSLHDGLRVNRTLEVLDLGGNNIGEAGAIHIAEALKQNVALRTLSLRSNALKSVGVQAIGEALSANVALHSLDLTDNQITDKTLSTLITALHDNLSLQRLNLRSNPLTSQTATAFAELLSTNNTLQELNLGMTRIDDEGIVVLSQALANNMSLKTLLINSTLITDTACSSLSTMLKNNTSLVHLDIHSNKFTEQAVCHLLMALQTNTTLQTLNVLSARVNQSHQDAINTAIDRTKELRLLRDKIVQLTEENASQKRALQSRNEQRFNLLSFLDSCKHLPQFDVDLQRVMQAFEEWHEARVSQSNDVPPSTQERVAHTSSRYSQLVFSFCHEYGLDFTQLDTSLKHLHSLRQRVSQMENLSDSHKIHAEWQSTCEQAKRNVDELRLLAQQKKATSFKLEETELEFKLAKMRGNVAPGEETEVQQKLARMNQELRNMQHTIELLLRQLHDMQQPQYFDEAQKILLDEGRESSQHSDVTAPFIEKLMKHGKWVQRNVVTDYTNHKTLDSHGNVMQATTLFGDVVILKRMPLTEPHVVRSAWNEISLLLRLQSRPSIIELNGAFIHEGEGRSWLVMEMPCHGQGNLLHWIKCEQIEHPYDGKRLRLQPSQRDVHQVLSVILKMLESVAELHSVGIEHRDLKPENILVDEHGQLKLIDFGCSKDETLSFATTVSGTSVLSDMMTKLYAPPERKISTETHSEFGKWDVYSLGVIIFEALCTPEDWSKIEILSESNADAADVIPTESGALNGWLQELVVRMLDKDPSSRPTVFQIAAEVKQKMLDNLTELDRRFRASTNTAGKAFLESVRQNVRSMRMHNVELRRSHVVEDLLDAFSEFNTREALAAKISFKFKQTDDGILERGVGSGVFREICELFCERLFSPDSSLMEKDATHDFYAPLDSQEHSIKMESLGKFMFHCLVKNTTLRLKLSPLVYVLLVNQEPRTLNGWMDLFRQFDSRQSVTFLNSYLHDSATENRQLALDILASKKVALKGTTGIRLQNISHIRNGFSQCMTVLESSKLDLLNWEDLAMYCCGPEIINLDTLMVLMRESLEDSRWQENDKTRRTLAWFKKWLEQQDNDGLRMFLRFVTANSTLPVDLSDWKLKVLPRDAGIRSQTCFRQLHIGVDRPSEEALFEMLTFAMEQPGVLSD